MSIGLFAVRCPHCDSELSVEADAHSVCTTCSTSFLMRFGHLIPTESPTSSVPVTEPRS